MIKLGTKNIKNIYLGETKIKRAYLGIDLVFESASDGFSVVNIPSSIGYFSDISFGDGIFVIVGTSGTNVLYSEKANEWEVASISLPSSSKSIAHIPGRFVIITRSSSSAAYSSDGKKWSSLSISTIARWENLISSQEMGFLAICAYKNNGSLSDFVKYSKTGATWTTVTLNKTGNWTCGAVSDTLFSLISSGDSSGSAAGIRAYSSNGTTFTSERYSGYARRWVSMVYGNGIYVALSSNGSIGISTDGKQYTINDDVIPSQNCYDIVYGNNKFLVIIKNSSVFYMSKDNCLSWSPVSVSETSTWVKGAYGNEMFVVIDNDGKKVAYLDGQ